MIRQLAEAGADAFRINMSHGSTTITRKLIETIRNLEKELDRPTTILADLQGPKLRVGKFAGDRAVLETGQTFLLRPRRDARAMRPASTCPTARFSRRSKSGARLLVDDGKLVLRVDRRRPDRIDDAGRGRRHDLEQQGPQRPRRACCRWRR